MSDIQRKEWIEKLEHVQMFLNMVRQILNSEEYELEVQMQRNDEDPLDPYTTKNTLSDLEYDEDDLRDELMTLLPKHYCKTGIDKKKVFCMSFHYLRWPIEKRPYEDS